MKRYCTKCGKLMVLSHRASLSNGYNAETGEKLPDTPVEYWQCPDMVTGYSDRCYQYHDRAVVRFKDGHEEVQTIPGD